MSKLENNIGWCDATGNPVIGCRGCELGVHCYARNDTPARVLRAGSWPGMNGRKVETFGPGSERVPTQKGLGELETLNYLCICDKCHTTWPFSLIETSYCHAPVGNDVCKGELRRIRYFADSNSDWMDWPIEILAVALDQIRLAPNADVILCTKWPENFKGRIIRVLEWMESQHPSDRNDHFYNWLRDWMGGRPPVNIWLLTSITTAKTLRRSENLLKIPAAVHSLSMEPLWENIVIPPEIITRLKWIIVGGESGSNRQDCGEEALASIAMQAVAAGVPVYVKQDCAAKPGQQGRIPDNIWVLKQFPAAKPQ